MPRLIKLKLELTLGILILIAILISGFFIFGPSLTQVVNAITGNYSKAVGDPLTSADWNNLDDDFVAKSGDTMTGPLILPGDPSQLNHAANKNYIDSNFATLTQLGNKITNTSGQPLRMVCGTTVAGWQNTITPDTIYIDTYPGLGFTEAHYLTRIAGGTLHYRTFGASNPYSLGGDAFRVYIVDPDGSITANDAINANWIVQWCVVGR